ncbi:MAG: hypothetical protein ACXWUG_20610 [Polyangiales bacterium]
MSQPNGQNSREPTLLTEAAAALEAELRRFEELSAQAKKIPLDSEKNLQRAAKALQEAANCQEQTANLVRALVETIGGARDRQQETANGLLARAEELKSQSDTLQELLARFRTLGEDARAIQQLVATANEQGKDDMNAALATLEEVKTRMESIASRATELANDAKDKGIVDIQREADSLRQQILSAKNKLGLLQQGLQQRPRS